MTVFVPVCLCVCDWSRSLQLSPSQMVQIWMPAWWFFQPQWGPEWLSEILEELEDRTRHKLDLLTKDNESDMQLSNLISLKHVENIRRRAATLIEAKNMFRLCRKAVAESYSVWWSGMTFWILHNRGELFIHSVISLFSDYKSVTVLLHLFSEVPLIWIWKQKHSGPIKTSALIFWKCHRMRTYCIIDMNKQ